MSRKDQGAFVCGLGCNICALASLWGRAEGVRTVKPLGETVRVVRVLHMDGELEMHSVDFTLVRPRGGAAASACTDSPNAADRVRFRWPFLTIAQRAAEVYGRTGIGRSSRRRQVNGISTGNIQD